MDAVPHDRRTVADPAAWLEAHGDYLFSYAMSRVRMPEVAEDLVQETLLAALQRPGAFQHRASVRTWLVGILKHKLIDYFRRVQSERAHASPAGIGEVSEESLRDWLEDQFKKRGKWAKAPKRWRGSAHRDPQALSPSERDELHRALIDCLERLSPRAYEVILLTEQWRMPAESVSKVLNVSTTNVGVLLFRARTALRHCLEVRWFGGKGARGT